MIKRDPNPDCKLPDNLNQNVFRYMDIDKFKYLLKEKTLYLCRIDKLQDKFEGTYSRQQIKEDNEWLKKIGYDDVINSEKLNRIRLRQQTYVTCWCLYETDLDLMWKAYIPIKDGVAIRTTVNKLIKICDNPNNNWPDISTVGYYDQANGGTLNYSVLAPFINKDLHFRFDNEIRIIYQPNIELPSPEFLCLEINPSELIEEVILKPQSKIQFIEEIKKLLKQFDVKVPISYSRDDRPVCE